MLDFTLTDNFQYQSQLFDHTDNITWCDQRKMTKLTIIILHFFINYEFEIDL